MTSNFVLDSLSRLLDHSASPIVVQLKIWPLHSMSHALGMWIRPKSIFHMQPATVLRPLYTLVLFPLRYCCNMHLMISNSLSRLLDNNALHVLLFVLLLTFVFNGIFPSRAYYHMTFVLWKQLKYCAEQNCKRHFVKLPEPVNTYYLMHVICESCAAINTCG